MRVVKKDCKLAPAEQAAYVKTYEDPALQGSLDWQMARYALTAAGIVERLPKAPISLRDGAKNNKGPA